MPIKQGLNMEGGRIGGGHCKIRKRGCWSSSSSSSLAQNYRFKRAILIGKRGGSSTPVPTWKTGSRPLSSAIRNAEYDPNCPQNNGGKGRQPSVSARKLGATLWEINEVPSPHPVKVNWDEKRNVKMEMMRSTRDRINARSSHLSDPSHSTSVSERMDRSRAGSHRRRTSAISHKLQLTHCNLAKDSLSNASFTEIENQSQGRTPTGRIVGVKTRLINVSNGLTTSKELLKVLNRIWGLEEQHSSSISLVSALQVELDRARIQVDQLIQEQRSNRDEIALVLKQFGEEKAAWKSKEQDRIRDAIASVAGELEVEKKLRRQTERLNKKLGKELADTRAALSKAVKELECEKRAREILEQVCDELARGIGEDRAEVEELKRESAKVQEEVEKERQMLQLADVLREERVQMKLSEAKYQFEEKNAAVDKLRTELEAYLRTKMGREKGDDSPNEGEVGEREAHEGDDSAESDLHSIELSMDNNSKSYKWSYANCGGAAQGDSMRTSVDEELFKGRKSISEKIQWANISFERGTSDRRERGIGDKSQENANDFDRERLSELVKFALASQARTKDYESAKGLRDHILSGPRVPSSHGVTSPTRQWG